MAPGTTCRAGGPISVDPQLGRVAIAPGAAGPFSATYHYGFNADLGGGEYPRTSSFRAAPAQVIARVPSVFTTVQAALTSLAGDGVVEIEDSAVYSEPLGLNVAVKAHGHIELRAADGSRPTLLIADLIRVTGGAASVIDINGLIIGYKAGGAPPISLIEVPAVAGNILTELRLTHTTVVPGWALDPTGPRRPPSPASRSSAWTFLALKSRLGIRSSARCG